MTDEYWMRYALAEARRAAEIGEVPVGAVVVLAPQQAAPDAPATLPVSNPLPKIIGRGHNQMESLHDPTAHAELLAITAASNYLNNWRLTGTTVYVTLEPCLMCIGALILARVTRVVFGAYDDKFGACGSVYDIPWDNRFNHRIQITSRVMAEESAQLLREFFSRQRSLSGQSD